MKPTHLNGLLLGAFLIFSIVYWNVKSSSSPSERSRSTRPSSPGTVSIQSQEVGSSDHLTIDALKKRVENTPTDTTLLNHLAQVLHDENRYEEAVVYYNRYLALSPANVQGWLDLANVYAAMKEWDKALQASQSLLDFVPHHPSAMYNMGAIQANLSNLDEAIFWWTQVKDQKEDIALAQKAEQNLRQIQS